MDGEVASFGWGGREVWKGQEDGLGWRGQKDRMDKYMYVQVNDVAFEQSFEEYSSAARVKS
jgi:hypothetical protein